MPFTKGHKLSVGNKGGGRKGYEFERKQLEQMQKIVSKDFALVEKLYNDTATEEDLEKLSSLQSRVLKYLDKLHPTKSSPQVQITNNPPEISPETKEKIRNAIRDITKAS